MRVKFSNIGPPRAVNVAMATLVVLDSMPHFMCTATQNEVDTGSRILHGMGLMRA